jgi:hypothetical protein
VHWLGWAFFRSTPWSWPLGAAPAYVHPLGSSLALTDAIPLVALALRPFASLLPADFQYLGAWLAACFALQGFFGARLASVASSTPGVQALGGSLFALSPVLLRRVGHEALCAHWITLALLWLALRTEPAPPRRHTIAAAGALGVVAAAIHPFLAAQALALDAAVLLRCRREGEISWRGLIGLEALFVAAVVAVLGALGYFSGAPLAARGYGFFSADLLTLVNPMGWSRFLPTFPTRPGQYEGYGFVGSGALLLGATCAAVLAFRRDRAAEAWRRAAPVILVAAVLWGFATTTYVTFAGRKMFGTSALPPAVAMVVAPFRSTGRFIWPLHQLAVLGAVAAAVRALGSRRATVALAAAVAVQAADLGTQRITRHFEARAPVPALGDWEAARGHVLHLALVPPRVVDADGRGCLLQGLVVESDPTLPYLAYRLGLTVNSGYVSRLDVARAHRLCDALDASLARGELDPETLYLPSPVMRKAIPAGRAVCGRIGGMEACVSAAHHSPLRELLEQRRD